MLEGILVEMMKNVINKVGTENKNATEMALHEQ